MKNIFAIATYALPFLSSVESFTLPYAPKKATTKHGDKFLPTNQRNALLRGDVRMMGQRGKRLRKEIRDEKQKKTPARIQTP